MKKYYQKPAIQVMNIEPATMIADNSVTNLNSNAGLQLKGPGNGPARSRGDGGYWDDEE